MAIDLDQQLTSYFQWLEDDLGLPMRCNPVDRPATVRSAPDVARSEVVREGPRKGSSRRYAVAMAASVVVVLVAAGIIAVTRPETTKLIPSDTKSSFPTPTSGSSPVETTVASTLREDSTVVTGSVSQTVWWSDLGELPNDLASLPLPPEGTISLEAVDGRPILVRRTIDQFCVVEGPAGGGGCTELSPGQTAISLQHGGSTGTSANGAVLPKFSYWLTSDAVTVSFVDIRGVSACDKGPQPILAYPGVTLWTCISDGSTPRGQTRSIYRVDGVDYLAGLD